MRRHVYNPLGKTRFALFLVFLLVGAWHGLKFHFFLWGALHGLAITIERLVSSRWNVPEFLARQPIAMRGLRIVLTQLFITLSWVLFFWA
jgi:alginate O-acetyltransferase complex protein AlgI